MSIFIPAFHFEKPEDKLKPEWAMRAVDYLFYNTNNIGLLAGKNVPEIEEYASGDFDMRPYKRMYKSMRKKHEQEQRRQEGHSANSFRSEADIDADMQFLPVAAIPVKVNSATAIIQKIPVEVKCTAMDPLAATKKQEDITFLQNKPKIEADLQDF